MTEKYTYEIKVKDKNDKPFEFNGKVNLEPEDTLGDLIEIIVDHVDATLEEMGANVPFQLNEITIRQYGNNKRLKELKRAVKKQKRAAEKGGKF